jgi:hypothetical protein
MFSRWKKCPNYLKKIKIILGCIFFVNHIYHQSIFVHVNLLNYKNHWHFLLKLYITLFFLFFLYYDVRSNASSVSNWLWHAKHDVRSSEVGSLLHICRLNKINLPALLLPTTYLARFKGCFGWLEHLTFKKTYILYDVLNYNLSDLI